MTNELKPKPTQFETSSKYVTFKKHVIIIFSHIGQKLHQNVDIQSSNKYAHEQSNQTLNKHNFVSRSLAKRFLTKSTIKLKTSTHKYFLLDLLRACTVVCSCASINNQLYFADGCPSTVNQCLTTRWISGINLYVS